MKKKAVFFFTFLLSAALWLPVQAEDTGVFQDKIVIGGFFPLSGTVGFIGQGIKEGIDSYLRYYNKEIHLSGKKLEYLAVDDQFVAEKSVQAVRKLIEQEKVFALVGSVGTPGVVASLDTITQSGVPFIYQGSGVSVLYDPPRRNVFPVQPSYYSEGRVMLKFIAETLKRKKIAIVFQNDEAGQGCIRGIQSMMPRYSRKGVSLSEMIPIALTETDFSSVVSRLKKIENLDAVVVFAFGKLAMGLVKSAREGGISFQKTALITTYVNFDPVFFRLAGKDWEDIYIAAFAKPDYKNFSAQFKTLWKRYSVNGKEPSPYNLAGWIAMETFTEGLRRSISRFGKISRETLIQGLETFHEQGGWSEGLAYKIAYQPFQAGNPETRHPQRNLFFVLAKNGQYQMVSQAAQLSELYLSDQ